MGEEVREAVAEYVVEVVEPRPVDEAWVPPNAYDEETKLEVVRKALEEGKKITEIAQEMGISRDTVSSILQRIEEDIKLEAKADSLRLSGQISEKLFQLLGALTKDKLNKAWPKDIAIAFGVLADKRRELLGPSSGPGAMSLRIAWKDGTGAVELTTGQQ